MPGLTAGPVLSPAHLSLEAVHRRGWGSLYAALAEGRVNSSALRDLVGQYPLADGQPIYAVDCSVWARCAAQTSPERGHLCWPLGSSGPVPALVNIRHALAACERRCCSDGSATAAWLTSSHA